MMWCEQTAKKKKQKRILKKIFFKLIKNAAFGKTTKNVRKHKDIKLVTNEARENYLVSEPNYHIKYGLFTSISISKIVMHVFWYGWIKKKYGQKAILCYIDTDSFKVYIKTEDIIEKLQKMSKQNLTL